jgi:hypothetical protein
MAGQAPPALNAAPAKSSATSRTFDAMQRMPALSERNGRALSHSRSTFRAEATRAELASARRQRGKGSEDIHAPLTASEFHPRAPDPLAFC